MTPIVQPLPYYYWNLARAGGGSDLYWMTSGEEVGRFLDCRPAETNQTIARRDETRHINLQGRNIESSYLREKIFSKYWGVDKSTSEKWVFYKHVASWQLTTFWWWSVSLSLIRPLLASKIGFTLSSFSQSCVSQSLMTYFLAHSHCSPLFSRIADNCDLWLKACLDMFIKSPLNYWLDFSPLPDWGGRARTVGGSRLTEWLSDWVTIMQCMPGQAVPGPAWLESGEHW